MSDRGRFLGKIELRYYGRAGEEPNRAPSGPPDFAHVEVASESADPGVTEAWLKRRAVHELAAYFDHPSTFAWPSVFRRGDVVRRRDGRRIGVVLLVGNYSPDERPRYELHVDAAVDGVPDGIGCWDPWVAVLSNDPDSVAEARQLGLRGLSDDNHEA